jgi:hypothetical protein
MVDAAKGVFHQVTQKNWVKAIEICVIVVPRRLNARLQGSVNAGETSTKRYVYLFLAIFRHLICDW